MLDDVDDSTSVQEEACRARTLALHGAHAGLALTGATILGGDCEWECISFAGRILGRLHGAQAIGNWGYGLGGLSWLLLLRTA
jgi:hypothetical protein